MGSSFHTTVDRYTQVMHNQSRWNKLNNAALKRNLYNTYLHIISTGTRTNISQKPTLKKFVTQFNNKNQAGLCILLNQPKNTQQLVHKEDDWGNQNNAGLKKNNAITKRKQRIQETKKSKPCAINTFMLTTKLSFSLFMFIYMTDAASFLRFWIQASYYKHTKLTKYWVESKQMEVHYLH